MEQRGVGHLATQLGSIEGQSDDGDAATLVMPRKLALGITWLTLITVGAAIKCYKCHNSNSDACGEIFKSYQFSTYKCASENMKCGKQTQPPITHNGKENWVGVIRTCYPVGSLPGINETDGCHDWTNPYDNFTAEFCFCSTDGCNPATRLHINGNVILLTVALGAVMQYMQTML
ncbi:uncharacterized protein LOC124262646 [Haliotis rubra]|uniref:uncharacterized protein LOC124262646 n=1 Tax=Haliotis rubra TaxID=36100 RepID=UPI001EE4F9B5|nr:uncharacterized protein LOC124262646 [Haliotis rubra]